MTSGRCVKCPNEGHYSSIQNASVIYCKGCFLQMVRHKFNYSIGKHHIFKSATPESALIVYTGDLNSALLLSFISDGLSLDSLKKLRIKPSLLFVLDGEDVNEIKQQVADVRQFMIQFQSHERILYFVHIASVLSPSSQFVSDEIFGINEISQFYSIMRLIRDVSIGQEILRILRNALFVRVARLGKCRHVVLPDNAECLANDSFNALCFGRGSAICELTAVVYNPVEDVQFVRPLKDVYDKEVHTYHQLHESSGRLVLTLADVVKRSGGIQRQNADFIHALTAGGFPATVPTILSIASKVKPPSSNVRADDFGLPSTTRDPRAQNAGRVLKCDVCFAANNDGDGSANNVCAPYRGQRTCEPCAALLNELAVSDKNICGKLIEMIKIV